MVSLQEQLLKAGLVDKKKVQKINQDKSKQKKIERRTGAESVNESREAALEMQRKNAERARELNAQRDAAAAEKAVKAQIAQLVEQNRQPRAGSGKRDGKGDIAYNFTHGSKIERIYVSDQVQQHLVAGRLAIVFLKGNYELVPKVIGEKIAERDPASVIQVKQSTAEVDVDDPYADYKIPDDFTW